MSLCVVEMLDTAAPASFLTNLTVRAHCINAAEQTVRRRR